MKITNIFKGEKVIWMVFFFLCIISIIEVFSASSGLTYKSGSYIAPMMKHIGLLMVGIVAMIVTLNVDCKYFKMVTPVLLLVSLAMLLWVLAAGQSTNNAQRWMSIAGIQFQPSEFGKAAVVFMTAQVLSAMQTEQGADNRAFKYIMWLSAPYIALIFFENFSTAALLSMVVYLMMFLGRVPLKQLGKLAGVVSLVAAVAFAGVMLLGHVQPEQSSKASLTEQVEPQKEKKGKIERLFHRADTWKSRVNKFINGKKVAPEEVDLDKDAQVAHANIAIVSSNIVGRGPGNSVERDFLSQAFSDFIYAIIIEEMGLVGAFFVAFLYMVILYRAGVIARRCENNFPALLAMGIALLLVIQAVFNMCVAVGIVPVTGQPLPLISKGGTSTILNCIYLGVILSISRSAKRVSEA